MGLTVDDVLEHHGIKGMHWGVRKARKQAAEAERNHFRNLPPETLDKIYNSAVQSYHAKDLKRINNDPKYKGKNLNLRENSMLREQYQREHAAAFAGALDKGLAKHSGQMSPGGNYAARFVVQAGTMDPYLEVYRKKNMTHADMGGVMRLPVTLDALGHIVEIKLPKDWVAQSDPAADFLAHYGVKGMHWGQRKAKIQKTAKRKAKIYKANRKAKSKRQVIIDRRRQLSENDLKSFVERLQTEKKLKDLIEADIKPGRSVTKRILSDSGQKVARTVVAGGGLLVVKAVIDKKMGKHGTSNENMSLLTDAIKLKMKKGKG